MTAVPFPLIFAIGLTCLVSLHISMPHVFAQRHPPSPATQRWRSRERRNAAAGPACAGWRAQTPQECETAVLGFAVRLAPAAHAIHDDFRPHCASTRLLHEWLDGAGRGESRCYLTTSGSVHHAACCAAAFSGTLGNGTAEPGSGGAEAASGMPACRVYHPYRALRHPCSFTADRSRTWAAWAQSSCVRGQRGRAPRSRRASPQCQKTSGIRRRCVAPASCCRRLAPVTWPRCA
jgi:hypothetical protein